MEYEYKYILVLLYSRVRPCVAIWKPTNVRRNALPYYCGIIPSTLGNT